MASSKNDPRSVKGDEHYAAPGSAPKSAPTSETVPVAGAPVPQPPVVQTPVQGGPEGDVSDPPSANHRDSNDPHSVAPPGSTSSTVPVNVPEK